MPLPTPASNRSSVRRTSGGRSCGSRRGVAVESLTSRGCTGPEAPRLRDRPGPRPGLARDPVRDGSGGVAAPRIPGRFGGRTGCGGTTAGRTVAGMNPTAPLPPSLPPTPENPPPGDTGSGFTADGASAYSWGGSTHSSGPRSLVRPRDGRLVAGVCASIADYLGVDVLLVRVVAVVLAVSGGAGLAHYLALWALTASSDAPAAVTPHGRAVFAAPSGAARRRGMRIAGAVVLALLVLSALAHLSHLIGWVLALAAIVIAVVLAGRWWKVVLASLLGLLVLVGVIAGAGPRFGSRDFAVSRAFDLSDNDDSSVGPIRLDLRGLAAARSRVNTV